MILPPRKQLNGVDGKRCRICPASAGRFVLYNSDGAVLAESDSPRWLSESALMSGALSVSFDFDLRLIED